MNFQICRKRRLGFPDRFPQRTCQTDYIKQVFTKFEVDRAILRLQKCKQIVYLIPVLPYKLQLAKYSFDQYAKVVNIIK